MIEILKNTISSDVIYDEWVKLSKEKSDKKLIELDNFFQKKLYRAQDFVRLLYLEFGYLAYGLLSYHRKPGFP